MIELNSINIDSNKALENEAKVHSKKAYLKATLTKLQKNLEADNKNHFNYNILA